MSINVICLKWGDKYDASMVNRLYTMLKKNSTKEFTLHCVTEDPTGVSDDINIINLPDYELEKWWWKLWILSDELPVDGKCVFLDLDIVIQNNIDTILNFDNGEDLFVLKAQWRTTLITKHSPPINSSIIIWNTHCIKGYFKKFFSDPEYYMFKYRGIDTYLDSEHPNEYNTLPTDWVYCRVWGYDDTVAFEVEQAYYTNYLYKDLRGNEFPLYYLPERMICLFNGVGDYTNTSGYYIDSRVFDDFESYWSD